MSILKSFIKEALEQKVQYTALVLDDASHQKLVQFAPKDWKLFAHHMTIISPPEQKGKSKIDPELLGQAMTVHATGVASNDKVVAVILDFDDPDLRLQGPKFPHVTVAVNVENGGKPMMSNNFSMGDFTPIDPISLSGKIEEIV